MTWDWHEAGDDPGAEVIPPYTDWERRLRSGGADLPHWAPVYVRVADDAAANARALLRRLDPGAPAGSELRADADALAALARIADGATADHLRHLFLYRPEASAHLPLERLFEVLRVGPSIPAAMLCDRPGPAPVEASPAGGTAGGVVLTGVIDDAIGIVHERFRDASGRTRVARYWRQMTERSPDAGVGGMPGAIAGLEMTGAEIDARFDALGRDDDRFYRWLEAVSRDGVPRAGFPGTRLTMRRRASHGTFVADLAAGGSPGPADRPIAAVELPALATAETWGARVEIHVLMALLRLIHWADAWPGGPVPLVVNLSYALSAGPRDGTGFLEREIARHVAARNDAGVATAVVLAAGNAHRDRRRGDMALEPGAARAVDWRVPPADQAPAFVEIRLPLEADLTVAPPHGGAPAHLALDGATRPHVLSAGDAATPRARLYVRREGAGWLATLALAPTRNWARPGQTAPAGAWEIRIRNRAAAPAPVRIDVQRDESPRGYPQVSRPSTLEDPGFGLRDPVTGDRDMPGPDSAVTRAGTLSAAATGTAPGLIAVGAARNTVEARAAGPEARATARYRASGPAGARPGPDLAAVAEDGIATPGVLGAGTCSGATVAAGGTSAAAPQVTRALVDALAGTPGRRLEDGIAGLPLRARFAAQDARLGWGILAPATARPRRRWPERA